MIYIYQYLDLIFIFSFALIEACSLLNFTLIFNYENSFIIERNGDFLIDDGISELEEMLKDLQIIIKLYNEIVN